jgi:hypothetical protein
MKVFFIAYLRSPENYFNYYKKIHQLVSEFGFQHVDDFVVKTDPKKFLKGAGSYQNFVRNIKATDIMVSEISTHSLSMGFLMHEALGHGKPVIALYHEGHDPYYVENLEDDKLQLIEYNSSNLRSRLEKALDLAKKQVDIRFNFFIPPEIIVYLDWLSSEYRISKSTYIRNLILKDMEKNRSYQETRRKK